MFRKNREVFLSAGGRGEAKKIYKDFLTFAQELTGLLGVKGNVMVCIECTDGRNKIREESVSLFYYLEEAGHKIRRTLPMFEEGCLAYKAKAKGKTGYNETGILFQDLGFTKSVLWVEELVREALEVVREYACKDKEREIPVDFNILSQEEEEGEEEEMESFMSNEDTKILYIALGAATSEKYDENEPFTEDDDIFIYEYETDEQLQAFIDGINVATGWLDTRIIEPDDYDQMDSIKLANKRYDPIR